MIAEIHVGLRLQTQLRRHGTIGPLWGEGRPDLAGASFHIQLPLLGLVATPARFFLRSSVSNHMTLYRARPCPAMAQLSAT
jgi:hypothetical protein